MKVNTNLNNALRKYRSEQAYIRAVSHVSVFSDSLLRRIVASKPCTLTALSKLNGIGQVRRTHYGKDIVRLVNLEMKSKGMRTQRHHSATAARGAKSTKRNALKGKPQAKSRKARTTITKSSVNKSIIVPAVQSLPLNASIVSTNDKVVLSRFFPLPETTIKPKPALKKVAKQFIKPAKTSVYVLELEDGRVYVGSSKDVPRRLTQHLSGTGSAYTRVYKPTGVLLPRLGNVEGDGDAAERDETLRYMMLRGVPFVRGWKFARVDMPPEEYDEAESNIRELFDLCRKCGYKGHFCTHCKATFDRLGNAINK
jgi:predicted GIY-YIG superfamily endonuclease